MTHPSPLGPHMLASAATQLPTPAGAWTPPPPMVALGDDSKLELAELWASVVHRKWAIIAVAIVVAVIAGVISSAQVPVYRSASTVLIDPAKTKLFAGEDLLARSQGRDFFLTQIEVLKSRDVAERTARSLKLWEDPLFDPRAAKRDFTDRVLAAVGISPGKPRREWSEEQLVATTTDMIRSGLSVTPMGQTQIVTVAFSSPSAAASAKVVNTLVGIYVDAEREDRSQGTLSAGQQLQERVAEVKASLKKSEDALQAFREKFGVIQVGPAAQSGGAQAPAIQAMSTSMSSLQEARTRRIALETEYQQAKAAGTDYASIPTLAKNQAVADAQRQVNAAELRVATLSQTLSKESDRVRQAESELAQLKAALDQTRTAALNLLFREYEIARNTEQALASAAGFARQGAQTFNRQEFELTLLERDYQANRQLYDTLSTRLREANMSNAFLQSGVRVIDRALPSPSTYSSSRNQDMLRAFVIALMLGALASVLLDRMDNTVKGVDDAETRLRQPVLAGLPMVDKKDRSQMAKLFIAESHSHFAEGIRTARTGVLLSNLDTPRQVLLVTSSLPGEGKTTVAINLAIAHSQSKRTLLIDADMRRSQVGRGLGLKSTHKGLTNLLAGTAPADACLQLIEGTHLMVLSVGDLPPNPLELLLSNRFKEALSELSQHFEMIIIDSPPVEMVSEALVLAPLVTSIALVVKAAGTPAPLARKSLTRLQRAGGRVLGVIVNQLDFDRVKRYTGEYGMGGYGYGTYGAYGSGPYGNRPKNTNFGTDVPPRGATLPAPLEVSKDVKTKL